MKNEILGISIGVALKGIEQIAKLKNSFSSLSQNIQNATGDIKGFEKQLKRLEKIELKVSKINGIKTNIKNEIFSASTILRSSAFIMPIKLAINYEDSLADVSRVVSFKNKDEMKKFSDELLSLTRKIPLSANELAAITASGGQLGIAKENLMEFTTVVAKMGVAFDINALEAGDSMAKLMNAYKMDIKDLNNLGDSIEHLSQKINIKPGEVLKTLKIIGGSAKEFGLSAKEASSLASAFISLGKSPMQAGSAINALLVKMQTATMQGDGFNKALNKIGMDSSYLQQASLNNPQKSLELFLTSLNKLSKKDKMNTLQGLFGEGLSDDIALLLSGLDNYKKALHSANEQSKGSLDEEFNARAKATSSSFILLKNSINEIAVNLGSALLPAISSLASGFSKIINNITSITSKIPGLNSVIAYAISGFLVFKPAFLILKFLGFSIYGQFLSIIKIFTIMGIKSKLTFHILKTSCLSSLDRVGALIKGIKTLILRLFSLNFAHKLAVATSKIHKSAMIAITFSANLASKAFNFLKLSIFSTIGAFKILKFALISTGIGAIIVTIGFLAAYLIKNWDKVKAWFSSFIGWIKNIFKPTIINIKSSWNGLSSFFSGLVDGFKSLFTSFFAWIEAKFKWIIDLYENISNKVNGIINGAKNIGSSIKNSAFKALENTKNFFSFNSNVILPKLAFVTNDIKQNMEFTKIPNTINNKKQDLIKNTYNSNSSFKNSQTFNFNFGDINTSKNIDTNALKKAVINEIKRQEINAKNIDIRD